MVQIEMKREEEGGKTRREKDDESVKSVNKTKKIRALSYTQMNAKHCSASFKWFTQHYA